RGRGADQLVDGLALGAQRDQHAADLRRGGAAVHDLADHLGHLVARQPDPVERAPDRADDRRRPGPGAPPAGFARARVARPRFAPGGRRSIALGHEAARFGRVASAPAMRRKFASSALPAVVMIDSGWNCTPSSGAPAARPRTPMISSSHVLAVTSSPSGIDSGAITSEW